MKFEKMNPAFVTLLNAHANAHSTKALKIADIRACNVDGVIYGDIVTDMHAAFTAWANARLSVDIVKESMARETAEEKAAYKKAVQAAEKAVKAAENAAYSAYKNYIPLFGGKCRSTDVEALVSSMRAGVRTERTTATTDENGTETVKTAYANNICTVSTFRARLETVAGLYVAGVDMTELFRNDDKRTGKAYEARKKHAADRAMLEEQPAKPADAKKPDAKKPDEKKPDEKKPATDEKPAA